MFSGWTKQDIEEYQRNKELTDRFLAGDSLGYGRSSVKRWIFKRFCADNGNPRALLRKRSTGRPPVCNPSAEDVQVLRDYYVRSNRSRGRGSMTMAARMAAESGKLSADLTEAILSQRSSKHSLPKSLKNSMRIAPDIVRYHRSPTEQRLGGIYCPGQLRMARDEGEPNRRLYAGERQSWDDATINFCVCVPWPWGGDKCSDKYGVKVGRFQLLAGIDDASDYCPGFSYVCRPLQSYRAEDATAAMFRVWRDSYLPKNVMIEGGVWQSNRARGFYDQVGVNTISAKGRPHMKLIESYWNRMWGHLPLLADGQVGRYRGEMERETDLLIRCQHGRQDPREVFPSLEVALGAITQAIAILNRTPVNSKTYGSWIPEERHAAEIAEHAPQKIEPGLEWTILPEVHTRVARRGMVTVKAESPLGFPHPYIFACDDLHEYDGQRVTVHFDPYAHPVTATITLADEYAGIRAGSIITHGARTMDGVPEVYRANDGWAIGFDPGALQRAIAMRKAQQRIVRTEYRAIRGTISKTESITRAPSIDPEIPVQAQPTEDWGHPLTPGRRIRTREELLASAG
jgi:hypothetical protein